jgi:hypothetical protein
MKTVLVLGLGEVGACALELLARSRGVDRIVAAQRNVAAGTHRTHVAAVGSIFQGHTKQIEFQRVDVADIEETACLIDAVRPDVILSSITMQSSRALMTSDVPAETLAQLRSAGFSVWIPWHLLPVSQLMAAVMRSGVQTAVVNVAFPDVVNPAIWRHFGTGPVLGAGNIEMVAATVAQYVCSTRAARFEDVDVTIVASHAYLSPGARAQLPSFLRVTIRGEDVTPDLDVDELIDGWGGVPWSRTTSFSGFAASAVKNVLALLADRPLRTTVTAPNGLPGGYPAEVSRQGVRLALPAGLALPDAIAMNEAGNRFDGIERLGPDGTVYYTEPTAEIMHALGYDCRELHFEDLADRADQLRELYRRITGSGGNKR